MKLWDLQNEEIRKLLRKLSKGKTVKLQKPMWNQQTSSNSGSFCRSEQKPDILNYVFESPTGLVA